MSDKRFNTNEQRALEQIMSHRRDIRGNRFTQQKIDDVVLNKILNAVSHAPSVGFSQPWELVLIEDPNTKKCIAEIFQQENKKAAKHFNSEKQQQYIKLKLEGIHEAPLNIAVYYKPSNEPVLGQTSMPEMGLYSVVCAIQNMWLTARAHNIGMGWVSILSEEKVNQCLSIPSDFKLVAYLCLGHVDCFPDRPELESINWEYKRTQNDFIHSERFEKY